MIINNLSILLSRSQPILLTGDRLALFSLRLSTFLIPNLNFVT
jgi:hypothetical protein